MIDNKELQQIRYLADDALDQNEPYFDAATVSSLLDKIYAQQAEIDALMLEFCPNEITKEQMEEWARHQKVSDYQPPREFEHSEFSNLWCYIDIEGQPKNAGFYDVLYETDRIDDKLTTLYYNGNKWCSNTRYPYDYTAFGNYSTSGERYRKSDKLEIVLH